MATQVTERDVQIERKKKREEEIYRGGEREVIEKRGRGEGEL